MKSESPLVLSNSLGPYGLNSPWNSPGQNTGVVSLSLYQLNHRGSLKILEWVAYPFPLDLPDPGIKPVSPALQAVLYQLSCQGSPFIVPFHPFSHFLHGWLSFFRALCKCHLICDAFFDFNRFPFSCLLSFDTLHIPVVQLLSCVQLFATPKAAAHQASLSFTNTQSMLKLMSTESVIPSNHLTLCCPFSCLQSFLASGSFLLSQLWVSGSQSIGASASVLPMNI